MRASKSALEIELAVCNELLALGVQANAIKAHAQSVDEWKVTIDIADRTFEIGSVQREGFFCRESTRGKEKNFVFTESGKITGNQNRLRRSGLETISFAIVHPECEGAVVVKYNEHGK